MDAELYQILSLALLGLIALVLLLVLSSLGRLRKALGERPASPAALPAPAETSPEVAEPGAATEEKREEERPAATEPVASTIAEEPAVLSPGTQAAATPEPAAESPSPVVTPESQPAAETPSPEEPAWDEQEEKYAAQYEPPATGKPEPETAQPGMATGWAGAGLGATSGAGLEATSQPETTTPETSTPETSSAEPEVAEATPEDEPQEQPFERDGKWYFRRDNELLTYEETTGQWIPAGESPAPSPAAPSAANGGPSEGDTQELATGQDFGSGDAEEPSTSAPASTGGGFWKCPSCGAVNGSTATTCRMCFTARP